MTTLLLVEDDPAMRDPMRMLLEHAGYRVMVAGDGTAALAAMDGVRPDAVITDWSMPGRCHVKLLATRYAEEAHPLRKRMDFGRTR
ncbi:response regulator [Paraburkholderia sp. CNPSo 3157]|uniref:Response regulator n=1 Tax=Paraburkholderia franconis TaxID=2654983 RepID=A0A7X1NLL3_9BURK|nr:response regulator [Paraburkholderia franconis]MPW23746.1 response regulator [Paraburkholderia franconis]